MLPNQSVVHVVACLKSSWGGTTQSTLALCESIAGNGVPVHLLFQDWPSGTDHTLVPTSTLVTNHAVPAYHSGFLRIVYSPAFYRKLSSVCRLEDIAVIHSHGIWLPCNKASASVSRRNRIPLIIQPRGMLSQWALNYRPFKKQLALKLYQMRDLQTAALLVATSDQEADAFRSLGLRNPIAIVPNGINLPEWQEESAATTGQLHNALFLSRIHPVKGLINLVAAWDRLRPRGWRMIVAGPDEENHREDVELAVKRAGLQGDFIFTGPVQGDTKEKLYRDADLFVLPSYSENYSNVVAEALSYGVPVITTKGTPWQKLATNHCGWWIDIGADALFDALHEAVGISDAERKDMGRRSRSLIETAFSWHSVSQQMLTVYDWVARKGRKPDCVHLP